MRYKTIQSANYQIVQQACQEAYDHNLFIGIVGDPGWGKTDSLKKFKKQRQNVFLKEIDKSMSPIDFYNEIIRSFGSSDNESNKIRKSIIAASNLVKRIDTKSLFVIDEAGKFRISMQESIREFHDKIKGSSSLILSGPRSFYEDIHKHQYSNKYGMQEMLSRIDEWVFLKKPTIDEFYEICRLNGFEDEKVISKLINKCTEFRRLNINIETYWRRNGGNDTEV